MFVDAGCGKHTSEQVVRRSIPPNVICVLPGNSGRDIIVGAHFDRVPRSDGVADNWSGASLLPTLYESVRIEPRQHTFIFIGFTEEEEGLVGSSFYARSMTSERASATDAMVNLDTLGLAPTEVWMSRSDDRLTMALLAVANHLKKPLSPVNFERVGTTDSESFKRWKIPRITVHSLTRESERKQILHGPQDKFSAVNLDQHYDTYQLMALYLAYLDHQLGKAEPTTAPTP